MDRGMRNGEQGTAFGMDFYTMGTKIFPIPVPGTAFPERGMQGRSPMTLVRPFDLDDLLEPFPLFYYC